MTLHNIYWLETQVKNGRQFIKLVKEYASSYPLEETLTLLRVSGIAVNKFPSIKIKETFNEIIVCLKDMFNNDHKIEVFVQESVALEGLFKDFVKLREESDLNSISSDKQIIAYLIATEICLGSLREYISGKSIDEIMRVYPLTFIAHDNQKKLIDPTKHMERLEMLGDSVAENAGHIFRFLTKSGLPFEKIRTTRPNHEEVKLSTEHINLYDNWVELDRIEQSWRFFNDEVKEKNNTIRISVKNEKKHKALAISSTRFRSQKHKWQLDYLYSYGSAIDSKVNSQSSTLFPNEFISKEEAIYALCLAEFLAVNSLDVEVNKVKLSELLRAIMVIKLEMRIILDKRMNRKHHETYYLSNWCSIKKKSYWQDNFIKHGIDPNNVKEIIEFFTFDDSSRDLLDCPIIPYGDYIVLIPSLVSLIDPSMTIISNLTKKEADISFKGNGFEDDLINNLAEKGIACGNLKVISNGDTFQCDCVFILDNDLFFLECKHSGQLFTPRDYHDYLFDLIGQEKIITKSKKNKRSFTEQLNRISDFFIENLDYVRQKFQLSSNWVPNKIYKIVLTNTMQGESLCINGCYVVDNSTLQRFIDRDPPGSSIGEVSIRPQHDDYKGEITSFKLMNIITDPPQISLSSQRIGKRERTFNTFQKILKYDSYEVQVENLTFLDKHYRDALLEKLVIPSKPLAGNCREGDLGC